MKATSVTDESGTVHEVDALVLTGGRWFGDGLPKRPPLRERLTDAPIWLDGAILPDGSEVYPPDLLGKLPWDDHELFRMGLQIDSSGRVFDEEARPYTNIYAAGRLLAGFNPIHDGCSMGVSLVSGARVGREITDSREGEMSEPSSVEST
jgi:anaerobic glycerol-3-phosphate dehydrogenase